MTTLYKAVRPDGTDFRTGTVQWTPPEGHEGAWVVAHPTATVIGPTAYEYLSASTDPTDLPGASWPMRLLVVEPVGETGLDRRFPNKVTGVSFRHVREVDAQLRFGPMGEQVAALIDRAARLTDDEAKRLGAVWDATWDAAGETALDAALDAAWDAARDVAGDVAGVAARAVAGAVAGDVAGAVAWDAARALVVRDLIGQHGFTQEHYDTLTGPWRKVIGPVHPDDGQVRS